jgi:hypothetical protein
VSEFSEGMDSTLRFNAIYARKALLLSEHSNGTMYSYRDIANFLIKKEQKDSTKYKQNKYQY